MDALKALLVICTAAATSCQESGHVFNPVNAITVSGCCDHSGSQYNLRQELSDIKDLLNTIIGTLGSGEQALGPEQEPEPEPEVEPTYYEDCYEIQKHGDNVSGVYTIQPNGTDKFEVFCDMDTDGGGWTVFQRRQNGSEDFYRDWEDYEIGFGSLKGEFWLGNDKLHNLTRQKTYRLRVDLEDFDDARRFAEYSPFDVADSDDMYRLHLGTYSGDAGNAMAVHNNKQFTTRDQDHDTWGSNCAVRYKGAWWYEHCHYANLNGQYVPGGTSLYAEGLTWKQWKGYYYSMKFCEMKLRPY